MGGGVGWRRAHCLSAPLAILVKADFDKINVTFARPYREEAPRARSELSLFTYERFFCKKSDMLDSRRMLSCLFVCVFTVSAVEFISLLSGYDFGRRNITSVFLKIPNNEEFFRSSRAFKGMMKFTVEVFERKNNWTA